MIRTWLVILSIVLIAALFNTAERAIDKIQEARVAETAREMVVTGQWLVPHYNGELRLQKPPFSYWTTALSYRLWGISELSTRIPSLLFGLLSALLLCHWLKYSLSLSAALATVWVLMTSFLGMRYLRSGEADVTLMFFIILSSYAAYQIVENTFPYKFVFIFLGALGLGFFTKGPAGIAIPLCTMILYTWRSHRLEKWRLLSNRSAWIVFVIFAFGWYLWIFFSLPETTVMFLSRQVEETFVSGTHRQPVYWYPVHALEFFAPWSLLLVPMIIWLKNLPSMPAIIRFALCWLAVVFVLLTLTMNKQTQYALLFLPPLSILIGYYIDTATGRYQIINRLFAALFVLGVVAVVMITFHKNRSLFMGYQWVLIILIPLILGWRLNLTKYHFSVLVLAILAVFNYLFIEKYMSKSAKSEDIKHLMQLAKKKEYLYQQSPGNGAISFYAGRIISVKDDAYLKHAVAHDKPVWIVSKSQPKIADVNTAIVVTSGEWNLWKLSGQ